MKIVFLLHFYQPHNQQKDILDRIVHESYLPLTRGLLNNPRATLTINMSGGLTELLLSQGHSEVVENLKTLANRGQVELVSSAMYHSFLPLLPEAEVNRQIMLNNAANANLYSNTNVTGFFSPEMAISTDLLKVIAHAGYKWLAVSETALKEGAFSSSKLYKEKHSGLYIFLRNKRVSSLILSSLVKSADDLIRETQDIQHDKYWFLVMDAETFGHHRVGLEKLFFDILSNDFFESATVNDLINMSLSEELVEIRSSTWTNQEQDFWLDKEGKTQSDAKSFILWKDPSNPIHAVQWNFLNFVLSEINSFPSKDMPEWQQAREMLDKAEASDQFWWASAKPWWSLEMIEQGAHALRQVIHTLTTDVNLNATAVNYYNEILGLAFEWQRSGYVRQKHLENSSTHMQKPFKERTHLEWYNQIILEFEDQMNKNASDKNFEQAIKWRDAIYKLSLGTDIYDVLHVVDELWSARSIPSVKPFFDHKYDEFSPFARENMLGFNTREDFEQWKATKDTKYLRPLN